jgi:FHS family glucose/mannose:H+ symporter-like MFS transporter
MNGSWAPLYLTRDLGSPAAFGSLALALFWALAAAGRVVFALASKTLPSTIVFRTLPFVLAAAFTLLGLAPRHSGALAAVGAYALAGLGVSALLPLVISFCERSMPQETTSVTSLIFAIYLIGYGLAAYGAGPLQRFGLGLPALYRACIVLALAAAALAFAIVRILARTTHTSEAMGEHA